MSLRPGLGEDRVSYKHATRHIVGVREANHHLAKHIKAVEERHKVVITRRGQPVARLTRDLGTDRAMPASAVHAPR